MTVTQPGRRVATPAAPVPPATPGSPGAPGTPLPPVSPVAPVAPRTAAGRTGPAGPETGRVLSSSVAMISLVCLWMFAQLLFLGGFSEARSQHLLYDTFRTQLGSELAPIGPTITPGDPVALLRIPALDEQTVVVEGTASGDLLAGPGHERNTVLPGQVGASYVLGRATTYGGPFGDIGDLKPGDTISAVIAQGTTQFKVIDVRRAGDPSPQPLESGAARLTLVSAEGPGGLLGSLSPTTVVYVDAEATKGLAAPGGLPAVLPSAETPMGTDHGSLPLLVLHLALLVALTLGIVAARQRWSAVLVWVVASPLALALAWSTTDVVMRLLPNLI